MTTNWLKKLLGQAKAQRPEVARLEANASESPHPATPPSLVACMLDVRLEQVSSLKQLRMHAQAYRVMNMMRGITLESMQADPEDPMAWVNIGRVQIEDEKFDSAKEAIAHARSLAKRSGNAQMEGITDVLRFQLLRRQPKARQESFDLSRPLTEDQYQEYMSTTLGEMFYVCQSCGHLNLMLGEHCSNCRFAPQSLNECQVSLALSAMHCKTTTLVEIAQQIQRGRKPHEFIDNLDAIIKRFPTDQGILEKIKKNAEDDYLNFMAYDRCPACSKRVWPSSVDVCPHCHTKLDRPMLLKLALCVDRILQQLIWNLRRSDIAAYAQFVILLVNLKYLLVRKQQAPSDAQRQAAVDLLLKISPLYAQNGGGVVWVKSPTKVVSEVLDSAVHKDIGPTMDFIRDELLHFLRLVSDAVSLF
ncbi:hypothetical protein CS053_17715 [Rhodanobacter glycinis]|uniref:Tetratricopeptide repeat protein n=1 Tax=Rhodanobacter glycinis TaxID=582702 RepID=A0A5B9E656_9GAMM|nr:hypothetical protein [Rhodanobacter glycinis]QEE26140.1 hypothetical protein CS053_17715 [Rhodanobacter glycinis]